MSGITIDDLVTDPLKIQEDYHKWEIVRSTEIVPRKMVEMIIEKCEKEEDEALDDIHMGYNDSDFPTGYANAMSEIRVFAKSLLKQFEEE